MKKWAIAAIAYLLVVMAGYIIYDQLIADPDVKSGKHTENHTDL